MGQYSVSTLDLDDHVTIWYDSMIGQENIGLIEGTLYPFLNKSLHSHEYFIEKNWQLGRLTYKGQTFEVNMLYNTFHDLLLIQNATNSSTKMEPLKLAQYLISDFEIGDRLYLTDANSGTIFDGIQIDSTSRDQYFGEKSQKQSYRHYV